MLTVLGVGVVAVETAQSRKILASLSHTYCVGGGDIPQASYQLYLVVPR